MDFLCGIAILKSLFGTTLPVCRLQLRKQSRGAFCEIMDDSGADLDSHVSLELQYFNDMSVIIHVLYST